MLSFGVTVLPDPPYQRLIELTKLAEAQGFEYGWTYDSHVLWQESMPVMALLADQTSKIKLGHMVTNPAIRDPTVLASAYATLQDISNGRMIMGVGRGDSSVRYVGRKPMKVAEFEEALKMVKPFMNGKEVTWNEKQLQLKWVRPELPGDRDARRRLRAEGARGRRTPGRRRDHPARRPGHHPVDHGHGARRPPRRRVAIQRRSSASSARRATSRTTSRTRATRCAGFRRWSRTTSRT